MKDNQGKGKKTKKFKMETRVTPNGVSLWVNGRWVIDASLFNDEGKLTFCHRRLKRVRRKYKFEQHEEFYFKPDKWDKR